MHRGFGRWAAVAAAVLAVDMLLILPNHPAALTLGALARFPLELPLLVVLLMLAPVPARAAVAVLLVVMTLLKLADLATQLAFLRPFNPALDLHLARSAWELADGAFGTPGAAAATAAVAVGLVTLAWWATGRIARLALAGRRHGFALLALPALALVLADVIPDGRPLHPPGSAFTTRIALDHLRDPARARAALADLADFRAAAEDDAAAALAPERIFAALRGRDILLVFVESYGRAALENPRYAPTIAGTLAASKVRLESAGLAARSGWLTAPMTGGQSWLAHASVLSGLWVANQGRYQALFGTPRHTLVHLAEAAGWRTVAVMPAMVRPWPEAAWFGYDRVLAAADLGYRGLPFGWITMPDQFTLTAFERAELAPSPRPAVFAEIALISSHAPWTPVPPLLDWERIGDGSEFDGFATSGDPPAVVWRDEDRIRDQYRQALDYTLRAVGSFAERHAAEPPLIVVLGDHQPAAFVSEDPSGRDVPVHLIGPPEVLAAVDGWGWSPGLLPAPTLPAWGMDAFRDRFLAAFAGPAPPLAAAAAVEP